MVGKIGEELATYIATQYSFLVGRNDQFGLGRKVELVSLAEHFGFEVLVIGRSVILRSHDRTFQVCA